MSAFCSEALSNLEKIVHPSFVPLALPIPETEEEKNASDELVASASGNTKAVDANKNAAKKKKTRRSSPPKKGSESEAAPSDAPEVSKDAEEQSNGLEEMIDVSDSGSNGGDIEEVPVEIDLADSEASDEATSALPGPADGVEIIEDKHSSGAEDFRLVLSPEPESANKEATSLRRKRRGDGGADAADEDAGAPPPAKVMIVPSERDADVDAMLASFVDKVKPAYDELLSV